MAAWAGVKPSPHRGEGGVPTVLYRRARCPHRAMGVIGGRTPYNQKRVGGRYLIPRAATRGGPYGITINGCCAL